MGLNHALTKDERDRRAHERRAANPGRHALLCATRAANAADPETLAAAAHPDFVAFRRGSLVGWLVRPDGCWEWTGRFRSSPIAHLAGRSRSVSRVLKARALGVPALADTDILVKTCGTRGCVAPHHHLVILPDAPRCPTCGR
jgi:hypothetical protein